MDKRIIYPTDEGGVAVIIPAQEWLAQEGNTIEALAAKDVPPIVEMRDGEVVSSKPRPFKIVDASDVPSDRTFRDAWEYAQ